MNTDTIYWIIEYGRVLVGYLILMYVWPSLIFRRHLQTKSKTYRFAFCATVQILLTNTVVLVLGLLGILDEWVVRALFYGALLFLVGKKMIENRSWIIHLKRFMTGIYGSKLAFLKLKDCLWQRTKIKAISIWKNNKAHIAEYVILVGIVVYAMIYFSYGAFLEKGFGASDMYVHHAWIYSLINGEVFSAGVYPHGMHCLMYALYALFGIRVYNILLFLPGIQILTYIIAAYCLFKKVFEWRYSPFFALILFLIVEVKNDYSVQSMARLQWALPQETGLFTVFLCALFLMEYLQNRKEVTIKLRGKDVTFYWDESLLIFIAATAAAICVHFYSAIMAAFVCIGIVLVWPRRTLCLKRFVPLAVGVMLSVLIAAAPMVGGLASGIPFQGSIDWAVGVIQQSTKKDTEESNGDKNTEVNTTTNNNHWIDLVPEDEEESSQSTAVNSGDFGSANQGQTDFLLEEVKQKESILSRLSSFIKNIWNASIKKASNIYNNYVSFRGKAGAVFFVLTTLLGIFLRFGYKIWRDTPPEMEEFTESLFECHSPIIVASIIFMVMHKPGSVGLPQLVEGTRLSSTLHMLLMAVAVVPLDYIPTIIIRLKKDINTVLCAASIACCGIIVILVKQLGCYHGYLSYELTRYPVSVEITNDIIEQMPEKSYTIVSTTTEIYQVAPFGWHEEQISFLEGVESEHYTLPSEYIFIYIEKMALHYVQINFLTGPEWLAENKYLKIYGGARSVYPDVLGIEISEEEAAKNIPWKLNEFHKYKDLQSRVIIQSKMYEWCERFEELHPNYIDVAYEDDNFVCYVITQNPSSLFELALN